MRVSVVETALEQRPGIGGHIVPLRPVARNASPPWEIATSYAWRASATEVRQLLFTDQSTNVVRREPALFGSFGDGEHMFGFRLERGLELVGQHNDGLAQFGGAVPAEHLRPFAPGGNQRAEA